MVRHPAAAAVHGPGCRGPRRAEVLEHREEGLLRLGKIADQRRPVIHFGVDVDGVLRVPRRIDLVVPDALQGGWLTARLARRDEQVAPVLHHQGNQIEVGTFTIYPFIIYHL